MSNIIARPRYDWENESEFRRELNSDLALRPHLLSPNVFQAPQAGPFYDYGGSVWNVKHPRFAAPGNDTDDDRTAVQAAVDTASDGDVIELPMTAGYFFESEPVYIDKALRIKVNAPLRTGTWGVPAFIVDSPDVTFEGNVRVRFTGTRADISSLPESADARVQTIYDEVDPVSARILCTAIYARRAVDRLYVPHLNVFGLFAGISFVGLLSATTSDPDAVSLGDMVFDTVDWGVLVGGGFKTMTIQSIKARNVSNITGDPSHAIYVGPRNSGIMNGSLTIGSIDVDDGAAVTDSDDTLDAADAFSIRSTTICHIGTVKVRNLQLIGNANNDANVVIGHVWADLDEFVAGSTTETWALFSQTGASLTIQDCDITARPRCNGTLRTGVFQSSGSGSSLRINRGRVHVATTANPGLVGRFSGDKYDIRNLDIIYDNAISTALNDADEWPLLFVTPASRIDVHLPSLEGTTRLAAVTGQDDHMFVIDPNLFHSGADSNTITSSTGNYRVSFTGIRRAPSVLADGVTSISLHGCNHYQTANTTSRTITALPRGTDGQMYLLTSGDSNTNIQHAAGAIELARASTINAGQWDWVLFICNGGVMYEVQRGAQTLPKFYTPSLTPSSVAANTSATQNYTVTGLSTSDRVVVNPPASTAGIVMGGYWVSATDTLTIIWGNLTAGALTPASGSYLITAMRP